MKMDYWGILPAVTGVIILASPRVKVGGRVGGSALSRLLESKQTPVCRIHILLIGVGD